MMSSSERREQEKREEELNRERIDRMFSIPRIELDSYDLEKDQKAIEELIDSLKALESGGADNNSK